MLDKPVNVLVADDDSGVRFTLSQLLQKEGYTVKEATDGDEAVAMVEREDFDVIILDVKMPRMNGLEALGRIRRIRPNTPVLIIAAHGTAAIAHQAVAAGAYDYFNKPFDNTELRIVVKRALERYTLQREVESLQRQVASLQRVRKYGNLIGSGRAMQEVYDLIQRVAPQDVTMLILGESGTGKELVAQAIVESSPRRTMAFIKVNCAAIPETLLESELFGHERGAFTGAVLTKPGRFELADRGTIFLDEIGDLSAGLQAKLLRVLQEREFERVGGTKPIRVNLRVLAATNADLVQRVTEGRFREDLYFRLNVVPITLPPLRKRLEDLPLLIEHFIALYSQQFGKSIEGVTPEVLELFLHYPWPGNVRELENVIQRACILTQESQIGVRWLPAEIHAGQADGHVTPLPTLYSKVLPPGLFDDVSASLSQKIEILTSRAEKELIARALAQCGNRRQAAADLLGISRKSLHNKMTRYGLLDDKMGNGGDKNV